MDVRLWSDYICPWCYLARDRAALLVDLGVELTRLPFELHPSLPAEGRTVRPGGRLAGVHALIARECADAGLAFRPPARVPNSRRALETAEVVRRGWPDAFGEVDHALFVAHFVEGRAIDDEGVLREIVTTAGVQWEDVDGAVTAGVGRVAVDESMSAAREHGVTATPAWLFDDAFVVPGVQPRELFVRVVTRLRARTGDAPAGPGC